MKAEERIALETIIRNLMTGVDMAADIEGKVEVKSIVCPYCDTHTADWAEATLHDGQCEKHPMARYKRAIEWLASLDVTVNDGKALVFFRDRRASESLLEYCETAQSAMEERRS